MNSSKKSDPRFYERWVQAGATSHRRIRLEAAPGEETRSTLMRARRTVCLQQARRPHPYLAVIKLGATRVAVAADSDVALLERALKETATGRHAKQVGPYPLA